jgi:hypothetical protein
MSHPGKASSSFSGIELLGEIGGSSRKKKSEADGMLRVDKVGAGELLGVRPGKEGETLVRSWKYGSKSAGLKVNGEKVAVAGWFASNAALKRAASESLVPPSAIGDVEALGPVPNIPHFLFDGLGGRRNSSVVFQLPTTSTKSTRFSRSVGLLQKSTTGRSYGFSSRPMKNKVVFCDSLDTVFFHSRTTFC